MSAYNNCRFYGRITNDLEVKYTPKGSAVVEFSIAHDRSVKVGDTWEKCVNYVNNFVIYGSRAETLAKHSGKGHTITLECEAITQTWDDRTSGQKRTKVQFVVNDFAFGSAPKEHAYGGGGGGRATRPPQQRQASQQRQPPPSSRGIDDDYGDGPITEGLDDDEIPF